MSREQASVLPLRDRIRSAGLTAWALIGIGLVALSLWKVASRPLSVVFAPMAIALVVVYLLNPLVTALERRGVRRGFGVALIYVTFIAIVVVVIALVIPLIVRQLGSFIDALPGYVDRVVVWVNDLAENRGFEFRLTSEHVAESITENRDAIFSFLGGVRTVAGQILHLVITVVVALILSIYLLLDLPKIQRGVTSAIPEHRREDVLGLLDKIGETLGGFFRGQLFVAVFVGVASAVGLSIAKVPFAVLIGLIAGIFNLVPLIGPFLAAIPAIAVSLLSGHPIRAVWAAVVLLIVQQIDNHIVSPNVVGRRVRLHPITVMLALLAGATVAGILGMVVVIPLVASTKILIQYLALRSGRSTPFDDDSSPPEPAPA